MSPSITFTGTRASRAAPVSSLREIHAFWETFGPLPEALVRIAVEHAVRLNTRGRHPRVYLHAIQTLLIAHWRSRPEDNDKEPP